MINAQSFEKYQWENRLILIYSEDVAESKLKEQLKILKTHEEGLKERKLIIFQLNQDHYRQVFPKTTEWETRKESKKIESEKDFQVYLIGLDGGVKLKQSKILSLENLFQTIDSMPMRQAEMRRKNN